MRSSHLFGRILKGAKPGDLPVMQLDRGALCGCNAGIKRSSRFSAAPHCAQRLEPLSVSRGARLLSLQVIQKVGQIVGIFKR
jgi:hypothetical protein